MAYFKYKKICDIHVNHKYFENGFSKKAEVKPLSDLTILPSAQTEIFFKRNGFRWHIERANSLSIYGDVSKRNDNKEQLIHPLTNQDKWVFAVYETNSAYRNLSDMPIDFSKDKCLYLTNLTGDSVASASELHLMKDTKKIDWKEDAILLHMNSTYNYTTMGTLTPNDAKLKLGQTTTVFAPTKLIKVKDKTQAVFDLTIRDSGLYTLNVRGNDEASFYYLNQLISPKMPLAVIEIYGGNQVSSNYQWENADKSLKETPPQYFANFDSRQSIWQYFITFRQLKDVSDPAHSIVRDVVKDITLKSSKPLEVFTAQPNTNDRQFSFFSAQPLNWQEGNTRILTLEYKINDTINKLQGLSNPLNFQKEANSIISKIFITL